MADTTSTASNKKAVQRFVDTLNRGSLDGFAEGYVEHDRSYPGETVHLVDLESKMERLGKALSDLSLSIDDMVAEGEKVAVSATASANHEGEFYGAEPTGERIEWAVMLIARVEDEQVAELWVLRDVLGILKQLELVPDI